VAVFGVCAIPAESCNELRMFAAAKLCTTGTTFGYMKQWSGIPLL
jgi:hypothetical protein